MGTVHDLIAVHGKRAALLADVNRREVEAAAAYMADEDSGIGFLYSGWCQAGLPHRRLSDDKPWQISTDRLVLLVEPGRRPSPLPSREAKLIGIPYGSRARLIMLYLQKEALRTGRREVELGRSMRDWLQRLGVPQGGKSIAGIRDQAERISRCPIRGPNRLQARKRRLPKCWTCLTPSCCRCEAGGVRYEASEHHV
jgi:Plasmid encoded RepA protein